VHELPEGEVRPHRLGIAGHGVVGTHIPEDLPEDELAVAGLGGVAEEPADEDEPETSHEVSGGEDAEEAQGDDGVPQPLARTRGDPRGFSQVVGEPPQGGSQEAAAVQRKARQEVEDGQGQVHQSQVPGHLREGRAQAECPATGFQAVEEGGEGQARQGSDTGDDELVSGLRGLGPGPGHPSEYE